MRNLIVTSQFGMENIYRTKDITNISFKNNDIVLQFKNNDMIIHTTSCTMQYEDILKTDPRFKRIIKRG